MDIQYSLRVTNNFIESYKKPFFVDFDDTKLAEPDFWQQFLDHVPKSYLLRKLEQKWNRGKKEYHNVNKQLLFQICKQTFSSVGLENNHMYIPSHFEQPTMPTEEKRGGKCKYFGVVLFFNAFENISAI